VYTAPDLNSSSAGVTALALLSGDGGAARAACITRSAKHVSPWISRAPFIFLILPASNAVFRSQSSAHGSFDVG
jgi:hypothetical protein